MEKIPLNQEVEVSDGFLKATVNLNFRLVELYWHKKGEDGKKEKGNWERIECFYGNGKMPRIHVRDGTLWILSHLKGEDIPSDIDPRLMEKYIPVNRPPEMLMKYRKMFEGINPMVDKLLQLYDEGHCLNEGDIYRHGESAAAALEDMITGMSRLADEFPEEYRPGLRLIRGSRHG